MPHKVIPLILSGGAGTRLWPVSREERPKQFLRLGSKYSLIQETLLRCQGSAFAKRPIIIAAKSHYALIQEALAEIEVEADILLEPLRRDSCAAIVAGSLFALQRDSNALVMTVAADHRIPDAVAFNRATIDAAKAAMQGRIVTFGIKPTHPATGYGYILPSLDIKSGAIAPIARFSEKPDQDTARRYIIEGCLWNSGNFLFRASEMLAEVTHYAPTAMAAVTHSLQNAVPWQKSICLDAEAFSKAPKISIDFSLSIRNTRYNINKPIKPLVGKH